MKSFKQQRIESLLTTIDQLSMAKIRHLQHIHDLKSYRNACRVIKQLDPFIHETFFEKEKVVYLNKAGREMIGSTKEVKRNSLMEHTLLCNEAYLYFNCPIDWKTEHRIESKEAVPTFGIQFMGLSPAKKRIISDASFSRNGYLHLIEIDNTRSMNDNRKKIEAYAEVLQDLRKNAAPILCIFTTNVERKRKFELWLNERNIHGQVKTFYEVKTS
ncbi:replication-relaxation family protein [Peribacillus frigoritolerans]|uniref:replication-relaxation family protein n=1 Tax=Peribacillus frigoritolerans TaxID=450367 RepID=UPI003D266DBD